MIDINLEKYSNLILDKQIISVLRWFKNNKVYSFVDNFNNIFDTSLIREFKYHKPLFESFKKNRLIENFSVSVNENSETIPSGKTDLKFLVQIEHFLNAIILKSFYRKNTTCNDGGLIPSPIHDKYKNDFKLDRTVLRNNYYWHFKDINLFETYYLSRFKFKNVILNLIDNELNDYRYSFEKIQSFINILNDLRNLLKDLNINLDKLAINQDALTGLYCHKSLLSSFYKNIEKRELKEIICSHHHLKILASQIDNNYNFDCDKYILKPFVINFKNINNTQLSLNRNAYILSRYNNSGGYDSPEFYFIEEINTVINKNDKKFTEFNFINFKTNNNCLRSRDADITKMFPFGRLSFESLNSTFFGVELECYVREDYLDDTGGKLPYKLLEEEILRGTAICKEDGSLGQYGVELNTVPMTLNYIQKNDYFLKFFEQTKKMLTSYDREETGIHIHISRNNLSRVDIMKIQQFINDQVNLKFIVKMSGRNPNRYCQVNDRLKLNQFKNNLFRSDEKFLAVNVSHKNSIELRIFKGTINPITIHRQIEFCAGLVQFVKSTAYNQLSYQDFIKFIQSYKNLFPLLNEFNLKFIENPAFKISELNGIKTYRNKCLRQIEKRNITLKPPVFKIIKNHDYKSPRKTKLKTDHFFTDDVINEN